jgi:predicted nucleotidyltransferase
MRIAAPRHLPIFRSEPQLRMLSRLVLHPDVPATREELAGVSGMSGASLHRELLRAVDAGLVARDDARRPHEFRADRSSPMHEPLAALLRMTVGIEEDLRRLLLGTPGIDAAALHGSWADNTARPDSDLDLLVVGDGIDARRLRASLREWGGQIGREVDLLLIPRRDFEDLVSGENPFLRIILARPLVHLIGEVGELVPA